MNKKLVIKWWKHFIPQRLPIGMTEFQKWSDEIIENYNLPNNDSMKFALATMIMHMDQSWSHVAYKVFAQRIQKSMANQIAGAVFQEIKTKQAEEAKAAELKALEEKAENVEVPVAAV